MKPSDWVFGDCECSALLAALILLKSGADSAGSDNLGVG